MYIKKIELDYANIMNRILMFRLVNSGQSSVSNIQDKLVKETFDMACDLLEYYYVRGRRSDFRFLYKNVLEIVPGPEIKSVMKHPEMYDSMVEAKKAFLKKTAHMAVATNALSAYMRNKKQIKTNGE